jgi:hypothetical protein
MERQALSQLKFIHQPISALCPGLRQAGGQKIPWQGFEQRVMQGIEEHKGGGDPCGLSGIEIGGRDRGVESDGQLFFRLAYSGGSHPHQRDHRTHNQPHPHVSQHTFTS